MGRVVLGLLLTLLAAAYGKVRLVAQDHSRLGASPIDAHLARLGTQYVPVYVMLPLDAVTNDRQVNNPQQLQNQFYQLRNGGVTGIMADVWWGLVER